VTASRITPEAARAYLHESLATSSIQNASTLSQSCAGNAVLRAEHTPLKMCWVPGYSDYYPEAAGGRPGGRSMSQSTFNANKLGLDLPGLEPAYGKVRSRSCDATGLRAIEPLSGTLGCVAQR